MGRKPSRCYRWTWIRLPNDPWAPGYRSLTKVADRYREKDTVRKPQNGWLSLLSHTPKSPTGNKILYIDQKHSAFWISTFFITYPFFLLLVTVDTEQRSHGQLSRATPIASLFNWTIVGPSRHGGDCNPFIVEIMSPLLTWTLSGRFMAPQ